MQTDSRPVHRPRRRLGLRALLVLCALGAAIALAACGSSGSGSTSSTASASTSKAAGPGDGSGRFASLRSCLQKQGITLPARPSGAPGVPAGSGGSGGSGLPGGTRFRRRLQLPAGVSQAKFAEALKKCGAVRFGGRGSANLSSASVRAALNTYAACLRSNGINVPAPNTSGNGPIFNTNGINTSSTRFKTAQSKCRSDLKGAFAGGGPPGPPGAGAPGSPPPAQGHGAPPSEGGAG